MAYYAPTATRSRPGFSLLFVVYLVIGGIVAATHHYWSNIHSIKAFISGLLATHPLAAALDRRQPPHPLAAR